MNKEYKQDDAFKRWARALQFAYREKFLGDFNEYRAPQVLLSDENAKKGLIFYEGFRDLILEKVGNVSNKLTNNMLRSEHIPYNIFTPLETMPELAKDVFSAMIGVPIKEIEMPILIEYAGDKGREAYLDDGTSFDAFVRYTTYDGKRGGIGIEVKYTENEYPLGVKEANDINGVDGRTRYKEITAASGYFIPSLNIEIFLKAHNIRQIWRNHILGYAMKHIGDVDIMHHVHLYPQGNEHFHRHALPDYRKLLTEEGNESFKTVTYETYIALLKKYSDSEIVADWVKYLNKRYLGK